MLKKILSSAVAMLLIIASPVMADEPDIQVPVAPKSTVVMQQWPIACMSQEQAQAVFDHGMFFNVWQGLSVDGQMLFSVWERLEDDTWLLTQSFAQTQAICFMAAGEDGGLVGDEAENEGTF